MFQSKLEEDCAVCLQPLKTAGCCRLACTHVFHEHCVNNMRRYGTNDRCPICRETSKDLTTSMQLYEQGLMLFVRKDYQEASRILKMIVDEIDGSNEKALELLSAIEPDEEMRSDYFRTLNSDHPERGMQTLQEFDDLAQELEQVMIGLGDALIRMALKEELPSKKEEAHQEFVRLANRITVTATQRFSYSHFKSMLARSMLIGCVVSEAADRCMKGLDADDIKKIQSAFFAGSMLLKERPLNRKRSSGDAEAAFARAVLSVLVDGIAGLKYLGVESCEATLPADVPWDSFLLTDPVSQGLWRYNAHCKMAFAAVASFIFGDGATGHDNRGSSNASTLHRSRRLTLPIHEVAAEGLDIFEQRAIQASLQRTRPTVSGSSTDSTAFLLQMLHDKATEINSTASLESETMVILQIRRYQHWLTTDLLRDPSLESSYQELPGGAKYFGSQDQYQPLIRALECQKLNLTFKHIVVSKLMEAKVQAVIKATRSNAKIRIGERTKIKTCPAIVKRSFIHIEIPSSILSSGPRSLPFSAPPGL